MSTHHHSNKTIAASSDSEIEVVHIAFFSINSGIYGLSGHQTAITMREHPLGMSDAQNIKKQKESLSAGPNDAKMMASAFYIIYTPQHPHDSHGLY